MEIREILEPCIEEALRKYNNNNEPYVNTGKLFLDNNSIITPDGEEQIKKFLTGVNGISSIKQAVSGLGKDANGQPWTEASYSQAIIGKRKEIIKVCKDIEYNKKWYKTLLEKFPTENPNIITNRFLATIFYEDLTTIVSWNELKGVLDFIGESDRLKGKRSDGIHWLELNNHLNTKIKEALKDVGKDIKDKDIKNIIPKLGWELVERIKQIKSDEANHIQPLLENNYNIILSGAPGTGKTYLANEIAAKMIVCTTDELKKHPQFGFVQFHPSYDYTDFVEGLRPVDKGDQNVGFVLKNGIFKDFCERAAKAWESVQNKEEAPKYVFIIDEINRGEISKIFGELFFSIDPGYRGTKGAVLTQYSNMRNGLSSVSTTSNTTTHTKDHEIEENIFDKILKGGANDIPNGHFFIPENVYIIGTMNDIDRSVESMDFAFRRRFAFYEVKASDHMLSNFDNIKSSEAIGKLKNMMRAINDMIVELGLTEAYQIGGAYFRKIDKYYSETNSSFDNSKFKSAANKLWDYHLKGTLYEYFRGEPGADEKIIKLKKEFDNAIKSISEEDNNQSPQQQDVDKSPQNSTNEEIMLSDNNATN